MPLVSGLRWMARDHIPNCAVWIDRFFRREWSINFARSGSISWSMNGSAPRILLAPVIWWTWPGPRFTYGVRGGGSWNHTYFVFSGHRVQSWIRDGLMPTTGGLPFRLPNNDDVYREKFDRLTRLLQDERHDRATLSLEDIWLDLHETHRLSLPHNPRQDDIASFIKQVKESPHLSIREEDIAKKFGISLRHFTRLCKAESGLPPRQLILKSRMERAVNFLRSTNLPLKKIASECGFDDIYYFTKLFRRTYGIPPGRYRSFFTASALSGQDISENATPPDSGRRRKTRRG